MADRSVALLAGFLLAGCSRGADAPAPVAAPTPTSARPAERSPAPGSSRGAVRGPAPFPLPGEEKPVNPSKIAGVDAEVMLAVLPERVGVWTRAEAQALSRDLPGRFADEARARYRDGEREAQVAVGDFLLLSPVKPGPSPLIMGLSVEPEPIRLGTHAGELFRYPRGAVIVLWLGDRCRVELRSLDLSGEELASLGAGLGLDALASLCARRDPLATGAPQGQGARSGR